MNRVQTAAWPLGAEGGKWVNGDILKPGSTGVSLWCQNTEQEWSSTRGAEALTSTLTAEELTSAMQSTNTDQGPSVVFPLNPASLWPFLFG